MSDFFNYAHPVARKDYRCAWCGESIPKGEKHVYGTGVWEGDWQNWRMHSECNEDAEKDDDIRDGFTLFDHERPRKEVAESVDSAVPGKGEKP
jgi:hypothetical protein